ncbi:MAG: Superoxide dismutase precursor [Myxococcaceae bacterium]|nr:Superoxide dismutase precursor [Myxococcaceae bacterium]
MNVWRRLPRAQPRPATCRGLLLSVVLPVALAGCWGEDAAAERTSGGGLVEGRSDSALAGFVNLKRRHGTVKLFLNVLNAPPGEHAVRLHQLGDCGTLDASSAGALWSPEGSPLGEGASLGDLGNLHVDESGRGQLAFSSSAWGFGDGSELDLLGHALVIHQKADELLSGSEGGDLRIGCGVLR